MKRIHVSMANMPSLASAARAGFAALLVCLLATAAFTAFARPAVAAPMLEAELLAPTHVAPGSTFGYQVSLRNAGDVTTTDVITAVIDLPDEVTPVQIGGIGTGWTCNLAALTCTRPVTRALLPKGFSNSIFVRASVAPDAAGTVMSSVTFSGGGAAAPATDSERTAISATAPGFGIFEFSGSMAANASGDPADQAGSHPYDFTTTMRFNAPSSPADPLGRAQPSDELRTMEFDLPTGLVADPTVTPTRCSRAAFAAEQCPNSSAVGLVRVQSGLIPNHSVGPIFNLEPAAGTPAQFGARVAGLVDVFATGRVRADGEYRLGITVRDLPAAGIVKATMTLWGVPADPSHDIARGSCMFRNTTVCPTDAPLKPFLTNRTSCSGPLLTMGLRASPWGSDIFDSASFDHDVTGDPLDVTGCSRLPFDPEISVRPTNPRPDSHSGYEVELRLPQDDSPNGLATSHLRKAVVSLPEGVSVSPSGAHGLQACAPAQIALHSTTEPTCPEASKIGTVELDTPVLEETLDGDVYIAKQGDNPFGSLFAIYIVARGPGVIIKLAGKMDADPVTGRLTTTFEDNPQLPFSSLRLRFKGGPTAPLANPPACGTHTTTAELTPWSGNDAATASDSFTIDCPGMSGFSPLFTAGTASATGGSFSPFAVRIERDDGEQYLRGVTLEMPPGLTAKLKDVPLCPESRAADGTCGIESRVGTATVGSGPGPNPYFLQGSVSLTGPYKGAPYGLSVAVRAIAGPFDLGTVVVRQAIFVDPVDAHLTVVSDPLPTILEGVPLRLRSVNVDIDRPGFVLNPTSCGEKRIRATLSSTEGSSHTAVQRFQVGDCRALPLRPRLGLRLTGRRQVRDGRHPGLRAVLTQRAGQANLKKVAVRLPLSLALDPDNARSLCEFEDGLRVACPRSSVIGSAVAHTPILNRPLRGPVYFVKGVRIDPKTGRRIRTLPTLLIPLRGEVAIDLRARSSVRRGRLVNTFEAVPDAPVSRFELNLAGGRNGILVVTNRRNLCRGRHVAEVEIDGHNGKRADSSVRMRTPCARRR